MQLKRNLVTAVTYTKIMTDITYQDIPEFWEFHLISRMYILIMFTHMT